MAVSDGELLTANADGTIASTGGASIDVTPDNDDDVGADADIVALLVDDAVGSP
jgi:hypothetical protein